MAIKERLGHASIQIDIYGGLFPSVDEAIAHRLDRSLRDALAPIRGLERSRQSVGTRDGF